ncbi:MAG: phosphoglycerate dehydrogenase [Thermoanaerobaculia bacterium]|nr:phosphoglycerate dehydrogenase [Thermoanaerobaculia bacterium]
MSARPKNSSVLVAEPLSETGLAILSQAGLSFDVKAGISREELLSIIPGYGGLVVRSATKVNRELLAAGTNLRVVGRAGVGLDNVDVKAATELGVLVVNAPSGNVVSAAEHSIAMLLALLRRVPQAHVSLKAGEWKRTQFVGTELQGKTVGLVGLGQVGSRVAARLRPWQVSLLAYDPYIPPEKAAELGINLVSLDELFSRADIISLHTPSTAETARLVNEARVAQMKEGVYLVNCARGTLIDDTALLAGLNSGKIAGAALDVFVEEPPKDFALISHPKVICTPHLGASTVEAQDRVAVETVEMLVEALSGSPFVAAVNLPFPAGGDPHTALPWMRLAGAAGELASQLLKEAPVKVEVSLSGVPPGVQKACTVAAVRGVLTPRCAEAVNLVNAPTIARQRGLSISEIVEGGPEGFANLVTVTLSSASSRRSVSGTLFSERHCRIVAVDGLPMEFTPEGNLIFIENRDVPGVVGRIGTKLGELGINIADFALARSSESRAAAVVKIDRPETGLDEDALTASLLGLPGILAARIVTLS